ncbi:hypothetical protein SCALM49S_06480 [Streptomyces californicus]
MALPDRAETVEDGGARLVVDVADDDGGAALAGAMPFWYQPARLGSSAVRGVDPAVGVQVDVDEAGASTSMEEIFTREAGAYGSGWTGSPSTGGPAASPPRSSEAAAAGCGGPAPPNSVPLRIRASPLSSTRAIAPHGTRTGPLATGVVPAHGSPFVATL